MKTCIHDKGVVEVGKKSNLPPAPPPAGDNGLQHLQQFSYPGESQAGTDEHGLSIHLKSLNLTPMP
ncbi:MAG: hypothetical protein DYG83_05925 [Candidatus Brocadia sp. AMX2]|uniref:hypothetical protein n=1 Tax=Candidatus Brocadia TaxID=380240 RepID=UPI000698B1BE|nr:MULTISPECIES: hypothetical protein [Brocadia]MBC6932026.1 hypothetical protein [Candidatus Brocadia sp.]MBL1169479.1 hypothetical protein [Candidatus Brocadia sp. AMX1]NOG40806.1 hypothetical protein [Planctomycetota bacterium]MCE7866357.1 hypothetical protein [Candidatus Brocadia sp. AMX2]MCQ3917112.1 hypothetical protein [Candidatus Brocadia sp.]